MWPRKNNPPVCVYIAADAFFVQVLSRDKNSSPAERHAYSGHKNLQENLTAVLVKHRGAHVSVLLAHALVEFVVVPWSDLLLQSKTSAMYVRGVVEASLGAPQAMTTITCEDNSAGATRVASVVISALADGIQQACTDSAVTLDILAPWVTPAFNQYRAEIDQANAWWVGVETDCVVLVNIVAGRIAGISAHATNNLDTGDVERMVRRAELVNGDQSPRSRWLCDMRNDATAQLCSDPASWREAKRIVNSGRWPDKLFALTVGA